MSRLRVAVFCTIVTQIWHGTDFLGPGLLLDPDSTSCQLVCLLIVNTTTVRVARV